MTFRGLAVAAFFRYFGVFYRYSRGRLFALMFFNLLSGYAEALGIAVFFPLLASGKLEGGAVGSMLSATFRILHVPPTIGGALPVLIVLFAFKGGFQFVAGAYQYRLSTRITRALRMKIVDGLRDADFSHVRQLNTGTLTNIVANEVNRATLAFIWYTKTLPSLLIPVIASEW